MTMKINIQEQYIGRFEEFISSLPSEAIKVDVFNDNTISFDEAQKKVQKSINNISQNQGLDLDSAFQRVLNY